MVFRRLAERGRKWSLDASYEGRGRNAAQSILNAEDLREATEKVREYLQMKQAEARQQKIVRMK